MKFSPITVLAPICALAASEGLNCDVPYDIVFLQDATGSFHEDIKNVLDLVPEIVTSIIDSHPGSQFAVASFRDKPYRWLGHDSDYCYKEQDILTDDVNMVKKQYSKLLASGGGDYPEAMLQAVASLARSSSIGWRQLFENFRTEPVPEDMTAARVIIMTTDDLPQEPEAYNNHNGVWFPPMHEDVLPNPPPIDMRPWPESIDNVSDFELCVLYQYPTPEQTLAELKKNNVHILALVTEKNDLGKEVYEPWAEIFEKSFGLPVSFVNMIENDSSDILTAISESLDVFTNYICPAVDTTSEHTTATTEIDTPQVGTTGVETTSEVETSGEDCTNGCYDSTTEETTEEETTCLPCGGDSTEDCCGPALFIRVNERPKLLSVNYEKGM